MCVGRENRFSSFLFWGPFSKIHRSTVTYLTTLCLQFVDKGTNAGAWGLLGMPGSMERYIRDQNKTRFPLSLSLGPLCLFSILAVVDDE